MFKTWVGKAATWSSSIPRLLFTLSPVGKSWKKLGTPEATYEGMLEPNSESTPPISFPISLIIPLRNFSVLVGSQEDGDGVIRGCSCTCTAFPGIARWIADAVTKGRKRIASIFAEARELEYPWGTNKECN